MRIATEHPLHKRANILQPIQICCPGLVIFKYPVCPCIYYEYAQQFCVISENICSWDTGILSLSAICNVSFTWDYLFSLLKKKKWLNTCCFLYAVNNTFLAYYISIFLNVGSIIKWQPTYSNSTTFSRRETQRHDCLFLSSN